MIGRFNPLVPHGDPPADVHGGGDFGSTAEEVGEPLGEASFARGDGIAASGSAYRCGCCTATPRYWRLPVAEGLFQQAWYQSETEPPIVSALGLDGVHFLKRQPARRRTNGSVDGCRWVTERVYRRGAWAFPGDLLPEDELPSVGSAHVREWILRPMYMRPRRPRVLGDLLRIEGHWHPHDPIALYETWHFNPWVLYSRSGTSSISSDWGSPLPVVYLFAPTSLRDPTRPPSFLNPPRKMQPFACLGENAFLKFSIGFGGSNQDREVWNTPATLSVTPYTP